MLNATHSTRYAFRLCYPQMNKRQVRQFKLYSLSDSASLLRTSVQQQTAKIITVKVRHFWTRSFQTFIKSMPYKIKHFFLMQRTLKEIHSECTSY